MNTWAIARGSLVGLLFAGLMSLLLAGTAGAATVDKYAPQGDARNFHSSSGGWKGSVDYDGLCVPLVTCPAVSNRFVASGGVGGSGDGFIETRLGSLLGVGAVSIGTYRSPEFEYRGAGGKAPDKLKFRMSRRADVEALLSVTGNSAEYSVSLERMRGGSVADSIEVVPSTTMAGADEWTSIDPVNVDPAVLDIGSRYRIAITSTFKTGAEVIDGGSSSYDDVMLRAMTRGGGGTVSEKQLVKIINVALPSAVTIAGGKAKTKLKCQRKAPKKCAFRGVKLVAERKPATKARKAAVKSGQKKTVGMKLRGKGAKKVLARRGKALLKGKVTVAGKTRKISRHVKVRVKSG